MRQFTTLEEVRQARLPPSLHSELAKVVRNEIEIAGCNEPSGSVWLLEESDTDETITGLFGRPLPELLFEAVRHDIVQRLFVCHHIPNNNFCNTLIVPDADWLPEAWLICLIAQT